jgi:hypothetical protein
MLYIWEQDLSTNIANNTGGSFQGIKREGHEAETSTEVKKTWIYTSTIPYVFMA